MWVKKRGLNKNLLFKSINRNLAEQQNFKVVPFFCGHGIGEYFHGPPSILHIGKSYTFPLFGKSITIFRSIS